MATATLSRTQLGTHTLKDATPQLFAAAVVARFQCPDPSTVQPTANQIREMYRSYKQSCTRGRNARKNFADLEVRAYDNKKIVLTFVRNDRQTFETFHADAAFFMQGSTSVADELQDLITLLGYSSCNSRSGIKART